MDREIWFCENAGTVEQSEFQQNSWDSFNAGCGRKNGAGTKSRTRDLLITNQLLYQLSYTGTTD